MDRRLFLTGMFGLAGAALVAGAAGRAVAMPRATGGILEELDTPLGDEDGVLEEVSSNNRNRNHRNRHHRHHRHRRRGSWRRVRVCRRVRVHGHWRRRCWYERVWVSW